MSTQIQWRRGTTAQHNVFTGASGEVTVDTDKDTLVVHDGSTVSGFPLARESQVAALYANVYTKEESNTSLALKVDKVAGKGLSAEDYTSIEKSKLNDIADNANNYSLPVATDTVLGGVELYSDIVQTVASNAVSTTASRTYGVQLNSTGQAVVNVPWVDTNTIYTHPTADGSMHVPATGTVNSGKVLMAGSTAGSISWQTIPSGVADHTLLTNIGTNTHTEIDTAMTRLANTSGTNTGDQTITLTGDITGTGTGSFATALSNTGVSAGTFTKLTTDVKGRITAASNITASDVPNLDTSKITTGTLVVTRGGTGTTTSTGTGSIVLSTSPTLVTPNIGTATGTSFNSITGLSSSTPVVAGIAEIGTVTTAARADHVHPAQTTITGNSGTATTLQTARTINGVNFDGSANITIVDYTKLPLSGGTMTGAITAIRETKVAMAADNIDLATGNLFTKTIIPEDTTLTISNALADGNVNSFVLELTNGGSAVITWFDGVKWAGGIAPTLTASGKDILGFYSHDGGTTWNILGVNKDVK